MHGLGNDFIVIDGINNPVQLDRAQIRQLCDRHFGVGCDQLLLVEPPSESDQDFKYRIFNADGNEVEQCGNGARCFARFVVEKNLTHKKQIQVQTLGGNIVLQVRDDDQVSVMMGRPNFAPNKIPLEIDQQAPIYQHKIGAHNIAFGAVSIGNPHGVIQVPDVEQAAVADIGSQLSQQAIFPKQANIGFMQIVSEQHIRLRVYERGAGETLACGTGACAAVCVGVERGLLQNSVAVDLPGGRLQIDYPGNGNPVMMTGPATTVFEGSLEL